MHAETPGISGTTIELMETKTSDMNRLFETIMSEKGDEELNKLGEPKDEHGCEPDEEWNAELEKCVKKAEEPATEQEEKPTSVQAPEPDTQECPEGEVRDPQTGLCVPIKDDVAKAVEIVDRKTTAQKRDFDATLAIADTNVQNIREQYDALKEKKRFPEFHTLEAREVLLRERLDVMEKRVKECMHANRERG